MSQMHLFHFDEVQCSFSIIFFLFVAGEEKLMSEIGANLTFCMLGGSHLKDCNVQDVSLDNLVLASAVKSKADNLSKPHPDQPCKYIEHTLQFHPSLQLSKASVVKLKQVLTFAITMNLSPLSDIL